MFRAPTADTVEVYYDGDCPICQSYVRYVRLREAAREVRVIDLRIDRGAARRFAEQGLNPDDGFIVVVDGRIHHAADALNILALLAPPDGFFNRLNAALYRSSRTARFWYPFLKGGRNLLLRILGRKPMNALGRAEDP
ncbi:MAG: DUF393 domain-containing protein [Maricaulaceae bacterium]|nr:DUF393 domain-containing protein [Maricaulaceae bacterium]